MKQYPCIVKVPPALTKEIGRIITRFSYIEHRLSMIAYGAAGVNPKVGRIAIRAPSRIVERVDMISDLLSLKAIKIDGDFSRFKNDLGNLESERDRVAHGIWVKDPDSHKVYLRVTRGSSEQQKSGKTEKVKRSIYPEGFEYDQKKLKAILRKADILINVIDAFDRKLEKAFHTLQKKSKQQPVPVNRHKDHRRLKPQSPPQSWQE